MSEAGVPIEISKSTGEIHPLVQTSVLEDIKNTMGPKQEMVTLIDYLKNISAKPRGNMTGGKEDLNSHNEEYVVKDAQGIRVASLFELQALLKSQGLDVEILGLHSIGNKFQKITNVIQGLDRDNPKSGFERPVVEEGPNMALAPFAIDSKGQLHVFRTFQMRTGEAEIDTPRGFADSKSLENGQQMYNIENYGDKVKANMKRIVGEESGEALKIKRIIYLGAPRLNGSFYTSKSAIFAVEVDYDAFIKAQKVINPEELQRRKEAFEHEGLVGDVLDITLPEYVNYKRDSQISRDMAADFGTDTVVIDFLEKSLMDLAKREKRREEILNTEGQANREFKKEDPTGYVRHRLRVSKAKNPENFEENKRKAEKYLRKLYKEP